jgi:dTMP kinase
VRTTPQAVVGIACNVSQGTFITFEGTEGCGKSTQIKRLAAGLEKQGVLVRLLREPGSTSIGEEIRHTLQHSHENHAMTPETELLLMNASRAQLVREVVRPSLDRGETVLCDRYFDSTLAYQGYGREMDLRQVQGMIDFAVGTTVPDLTLYLRIPLEVSEQRRVERAKQAGEGLERDRMEEADAAFFKRVEKGFEVLARDSTGRIVVVDGTESPDNVEKMVWDSVWPLLQSRQS